MKSVSGTREITLVVKPHSSSGLEDSGGSHEGRKSRIPNTEKWLHVLAALMSELADLFDSADIAPRSVAQPQTFWRVRLACRSVTFVYFVLWVLVLATFDFAAPSVPACPDSWCTLHDTAGTVEFLWTGLVETATIRVERFDRRGTEPFEPFEFFQNRNFPAFFPRNLVEK